MKEKELAKLKNRALLIVNFLIAHSSDSVIFSETIKVIEISFVKNNLRGLEIINNDLNEWVQSLPEIERNELNGLLTDKNLETFEVQV